MKEEYLKLNDGSRMPRLGMGTWYLGENKAARKQEIEAGRIFKAKRPSNKNIGKHAG